MRYVFKKRMAISASVLLIGILAYSLQVNGAPVPQEYYQIRIYNISSKSQEDRIDAYLKNVYIPALYRAGIMQVGVFKPIKADTVFYGKLIYLFFPLRNLDHYVNLQLILNNDKEYVANSKSFIDAPYNDPPYARFENILLRAFINMPKFRAPKFTTVPGERIYELRSYESATEAKALKKIEMFNQGGEMTIFEKLGFNAAFYGEVLFGSHMPNLMYMTTFENRESRDAHWKAFQNHPDWLVLKAMEEYQNTTSRTGPSMLLNPTDYSDF